MRQSEPPQIHGGQLREIAQRFGVVQSRLLDFSANINPDGPPPAVLLALKESLDDLSVLTSYPDLQQTELKQSISRHAGINPENIVVANGFVPLLDTILRSLSIQSCLLPVPAFIEYSKALTRAGIAISREALVAESGFSYVPLVANAGQHGAILVANPQNPSGICHDAKTMLDLVGRAAEKDTYVLLDEAFIDYVPEHSLTSAACDLSNLIVFRSVTKFHGVPGLRVAYAVSNPALACSINQNLPPWPITTLASRGVSAALADKNHAERARAINRERREELKKELERLGLFPYPSSANFLLFKTPPDVDPIMLWQDLIVKHHIVVRSCVSYEGLSSGHLRVAVRTTEENLRLVQALKETLSGRQVRSASLHEKR